MDINYVGPSGEEERRQNLKIQQIQLFLKQFQTSFKIIIYMTDALWKKAIFIVTLKTLLLSICGWKSTFRIHARSQVTHLHCLNEQTSSVSHIMNWLDQVLAWKRGFCHLRVNFVVEALKKLSPSLPHRVFYKSTPAAAEIIIGLVFGGWK